MSRNKTKRKRWLELKQEDPVVMIATPAQDTVLTCYARCLVGMVAHSFAQGMTLGYQIAQYSILPFSRNELVRGALERKATHVLFIDSDMEFPTDTALRLIRHHKSIMAANCMGRRRPYSLTARTAAGEEVVTGPDTTGIEKVHRVGTGVMLVDLEVFKALPEPWFDYRWKQNEDGSARPVGEDFVFVDAAREAGFEVFVDHDLSKEVNHVGTFQYTPLIRAGFEEVEQEMQAAEKEHAHG